MAERENEKAEEDPGGGGLCVLLLMSLNISSLAERGGEIFPVSRSSVISHTPADTEQTGQMNETDRSEDPGEEATPADADL